MIENFKMQANLESITYDQYIAAELAKAKMEALDPDTNWISQDEMKARLKERREARANV